MNFKWQGGQLLDSVVSLSVPCVLCARLMRLSFSFLVAICKREQNTKHFRMGHKKATHPPRGMLSFLYRGGRGFLGVGGPTIFWFLGHHLICGTAHLLQPEVISRSISAAFLFVFSLPVIASVLGNLSGINKTKCSRNKIVYTKVS